MICTKCNIEKTTDDFYVCNVYLQKKKDGEAKNHYYKVCKICKRDGKTKYMREYRKKQKEEMQQKKITETAEIPKQEISL